MRKEGCILTFTLALGAFACGGEKKDQEAIFEYYIEDGEFEGSGKKRRSGEEDAIKQDGPRISFVSPEADVTADGVVEIEVAFQDVADDATWSVHYASSAEATDGTAIAQDQSVGSTKVEWDTTEVNAGTYYLHATLKSGDVTKRAKAEGKITIGGSSGGEDAGAEDGEDEGPNTAPTLALTFPNGENVLVAGVPQAIKFNAADADDDDLTYRIEYSADGGTTWTELAKDLTTPSYDWDVAGLAQGINYRVRVTADDGKGGTVQATSEKSFGVATTPMTFAAGFGAMLNNRCGNCHRTGGPNQNQFRSDNFALANIGVSAKQMNLKNRIEAGTMPPGGALGAADKAILTMWLWSGAQ
jgi:hypothetical protein